MNRPIKFRLYFEGGIQAEEYVGEDNQWHFNKAGLPFPVTKFIARVQFTGLLDKNGKEIYEGDILSLNDYLNHTAIFWIGYDEEDAGFSFNEVGYGQAVPAVVAGRSEIIGNIYENKELIKKK